MTGDIRLVSLRGLGAPLLFRDCAFVARSLLTLVPGWPESHDSAGDATLIISRLNERSFRVEMPGLGYAPIEARDEVEACHLILGCLPLLHERPEAGLPDRRVFLHSAAAVLGGKLVLVAGPSHAGKSTLGLALAMAGAAFAADDNLPLLPPTGTAAVPEGLVLAPVAKLRCPPARALGPIAAYAERHCRLENEDEMFVVPPSESRHENGARLPIGAVLLPKRGGPFSLDRVTEAAALEALISLSHQERTDRIALVRLLKSITEHVPCYTCSYDDAAKLARHLVEFHPQLYMGTAAMTAGI